MTAVNLVGERVVLRLAEARDATSIVDFYKRNRVHLRPWEPVRPREFYTKTYWIKQIRTNRAEWRASRSLRLFLFEREHADRVAGTVNFSNFVRGAFHACHLGYSIDARLQGQGLMTEALGLAIRFMFDNVNFHRIMANYVRRNRRSARLLSKLGFRTEGTARDYLLIAGRWQDHVLTSRVNGRWKQPKRSQARRH